MGLISRVSSRTYRYTVMQIFIKDQSIVKAMNVEESTTVGELKQAFPAGQMHVSGAILDDGEAVLAELGIQENPTIEIVHPVLGGGRKRKKKVYTTPKKIKHKRVKVKLATLKYYNVTDAGKVERKRKECPSDLCGPGIFMSNHKDRQYCGKCGLTVKFDEKK